MRRALDNGQVGAVLELAAAGNRHAQIACFERVVPPLAAPTVADFRIRSAAQASAAMQAVLDMLRTGDLGLAAAHRLSRQIDARRRKLRTARIAGLLAAITADPVRAAALSRATDAAPNSRPRRTQR